jgi:hypothetical protein
MALLHWYKLDGNTNDSIGNNNLPTNTATYTSTGKIGGAYTFAASNAIYNTSGLTLYYDATISAWGYATLFPTNHMLFSLNSGAFSGADLFFAGDTICWNTGDGSGNPFKNNGIVVIYPSLNVWHHYTVVISSSLNKAILYLDGAYYGEAIYKSPYQINKGFTIGNYYPGSTGYAWIGIIDDVRIYNHALSLKEVKELSQAKVLHYNFDDFQEPTTNLVSNPTYEVNGSEFTQWGDLAPIFDTYGTSFAYSLSLDLKTNIGGNVQVYMQNGSATKYEFIYANVTSTTYYQRFTFDNLTATISNPAETQAQLAFYTGYGSGRYTSVKNVQVEIKSVATPFVNGSRTGVVHDVSGYNNNAPLVLATTPQWYEDGIGRGCYRFNGTTQRITTSLTATQLTSLTTCSISFWRKSTALASWLPFTGQSNSEYIMATSGGTGAFYHGNTAGTKTIYVDGVISTTPSTNVTNWHHYVITDVNLSLWTSFNIGGYPGEWLLEGDYDDVRIYNTVLTQSDVTELYQTRANLDNVGNLFTKCIMLPEDVTKDLVAYYPLDGNANDYSGNGNNGTISGATSTSGIINGAYSFDGTGDYILVSNSLGSTETFNTVSAWVKRAASTSWTGSVFGFGIDGNSTQDIYFWGAEGFFGFNTWNGDCWGFSNSTAEGQVMDGEWHHLVAIFDRSSITSSKIFVDGIEKALSQVKGTTLTRTISYKFGIGLNGWNTANQLFNGIIDDVHIYNRALTPSEIKLLYSKGFR